MNGPEETTTSTAPSPISLRMEEEHLKHRRIFLWGQVDEKSSRHVVERILYLDSIDPGKDINLIINSPGGLNTAGFAILDAMEQVSSPVATHCTGLAASFGALLLLCGEPGKRYATHRARIMLHQPWVPGEIRSVATDLAIHALEIKKQRNEINELIARHCHHPIEEVEKETDRDFWMNSKDALTYGIIDSIGGI